jgi:pyruvate/2-oxoglutarate dehydrogenase complex dihydrolipoamide dehydrogenase (E3) component
MSDDGVDVAVVGGGSAGLGAAQVVAASGRRVVLVESARLGGECTWNGCVPSKSLIEAARHAHAIARAPRFGIDATGVTVDFPRVMARVRETIRRIAAYEDAAHLETAGITVRSGRATLAGPAELRVDGEPVAAGRIVLCTGSRPAVPPVPGLDAVPYLTNETLFELTEQPRHLLVIGAGPIGLEMAQAFRRLGSEVSVVDVLDSLLPREDPDIARLAGEALATEGVRIRLGVRVEAAEYDRGTHRLRLRRGAEQLSLEGDALLVATGRRPNVDGLGLEAAGVRVERRGIAVDDRMRTNVPGILAAGDVTGLYPFTHAAAYQGRIAAATALGERRRADYRVVPWVTFTDPEIAHLGLTEPEARRQHGDDVTVAHLPLTAVDRAVIQGEVRGMVKVITHGRPVIGHLGGGALLGAHLIGPGAGELVHELAVAMQTGAFAGRLAQTIHAYPTMALAVQQAAAQLFPLGRATAGDLREELAAED